MIIGRVASNSLTAYYNNNFILSLIQLEWVKSFRVTVVNRIIKKYCSAIKLAGKFWCALAAEISVSAPMHFKM